MTLTNHQKAELREAILGAMPEMVDLDNNGPWWWECGCNDDGHLNNDGRMCSLSGAWEHVVDDHLAPLIDRWLTPTPCNMTHTEPFDFAQCETHDTTFPLGSTCKFDGREPWEVFAEEADEQRRRAVKTEHRLALAEARIGPQHVPYTDDGVTYCGWRGDSEVFNGCGEVWPCSTVRAKTGHQDDA